MSKWWKRKKRIGVNLTVMERERVLAWLDQHIAVFDHALARYSTIPEDKRPGFVKRNMDYYRHGKGALNWLKASALSKIPDPEPESPR